MAEKKTNTKPVTPSEVKTATPVKTQHKKHVLAFFVGLIFLFVALYLFKGTFIAADVNGEKITRFAVIKELEKQSGKQTLESMVTKSLIIQEAKKRGINIMPTDIDKEIAKIAKNIEGQGSTLDQALALQGMTRNQLREEIKVQLMMQALVSQKTNVTDKEIAEFLETNKEQLPEGMNEDQLKKLAKEQLVQQKVSTEAQNVISELQKNSRTIYFIKY